ncbi:MAG: agmatinase [Thermoprotei archaeon]|nr:agmatinase [Thermoprotei archaeon]
MGYVDLYVVRRPLTFAGIEGDRGRALFSVVGVPFDSTSTHRTGQRYGPLFVREASMNIESNGYSVEGFIEDVPFYDEGDVGVVHGSVGVTIDRVSKVVSEIAGEGRVPVVIGGEHTITLGVIRGLKATGLRPCVLAFDAHFDLRLNYLSNTLSHACTMRRVLEELGGVNIAFIGVRGFDREELSFANGNPQITYYTPRTLESMGVASVVSEVKKFLSECGELYITVDMDVYDPAYAPGVGNPEPGGLTSREALPMLAALVDERVVGLDVMEVTPQYDVGGVTSMLAAKTLQEALIAAFKGRAKQP